MADELYTKKVLEFQNEFFARLSHGTLSKPPVVVPSLFHFLLATDDEVIEYSLGKLGHKLKAIAKEVDYGHPELQNIFDGILADNQDFSRECTELVTLAKLARSENLTTILPAIGRTVVKEFDRNIVRKIDTPANNRMHVRLLKSKEEREKIRFAKKMQIIDLQGVYKKGEEYWTSQPDNFRRFLRFDTTYQEDMKKAETKARCYEELGCLSLAEEVRRSVEVFKEHIDQSYYGFNRITMTNAAVILAKSLGFTYTPPKAPISGGLYIGGSDERTGRIIVQRKFFGRFDFDPQHILEFSPHISEVAARPVFTEKPVEPLLYEPRVYPLYEFQDVMPEGVSRTIGLLEEFPDAHGKPIFDHFGIIVPGVNFPRVEPWEFTDDAGILQRFQTREDALKALDKILVKGRYFYPIIVGEKDGKCYFVSFFV